MTYTGRYLLILKCELQFVWFPIDSHECTVTFEMGRCIRYICVTYVLIFPLFSETEQPAVVLHFTNDLIQNTAQSALHVSGFQVHLSPAVSYNATKVVKNKEMEVNGVRFSVILERVYSNHILHTYIPSVMLCIASTCSLFIPSDLIPGRMGLCITTFLSIISLFNGAKYDFHLNVFNS